MQRPSNDSPKEWYNAALLYDENRIANEVFVSALQETHPSEDPSLLGEQPDPTTQTLTMPPCTFRDKAVGIPSSSRNHFAILAVEEGAETAPAILEPIIQIDVTKERTPCPQLHPKWER
jgi:hypothetical protein